MAFIVFHVIHQESKDTLRVYRLSGPGATATKAQGLQGGQTQNRLRISSKSRKSSGKFGCFCDAIRPQQRSVSASVVLPSDDE